MRITGRIDLVTQNLRDMLEDIDGTLVVESYSEAGDLLELECDHHKLFVPETCDFSFEYQFTGADTRIHLDAYRTMMCGALNRHTSWGTDVWRTRDHLVCSRVPPESIEDQPSYYQEVLYQKIFLDPFGWEGSMSNDRESLTDFYRDKVSSKERIEGELQEKKQEYQNTLDNLYQIQEEIQNIEKRIDLISEKDAEQEVEEMVGRLRKMRSYQSFSFSSSKLVGVTTPVVVDDIEFGTYRVCINPALETIHIHPRDDTFTISGERGCVYHHPHVWRSGRPCLGGFEKHVDKLLSLYKYSDLFEIIRHFLSHYNADSPVYPIKNWRNE